MTMIDRVWYAARFRSGEEAAAARALCNGTVGALVGFCPLVRLRWTHRGSRQERLMPVMAGYVFVEMPPPTGSLTSPYAYRWQEVATQHGFLGFVGGDRPQPARRAEVEDLVVRACPETWEMAFESPITPQGAYFERGEAVRIAVSGNTLSGIVEWMRRGAATAKVRVRGLFGIEVHSEVPVACLERVALESKRARKTFYDLAIVNSARI